MNPLGQSSRALWAHMKRLWPEWTLLPALPFVAWPAYCFARGEYRWELAALALLGGVLPYVGPRSKRLFGGLLPLGLTGVFYDAMRFVKGVGQSAAQVHLCDLRGLEMQAFGSEWFGGRSTVHDFLQAHASLPLDVFFAVPYGSFLGAASFFGVFLYFVDYPAMRRFTWSFLAMNLAAFVCYRLYPAAPPWYFHAHGCAVDLAARASEGPNLARVDAWLGVDYFGGFYARSKNVFGAMPSLHCAYPLLIVLEGWTPFAATKRAKWPLRAAAASYSLWMCAAAVYLDHHWILDVVAGLGFAVVTFASFRGARRLLARGGGHGAQRVAGHGALGSG
jgi:membrane-associated phospholipid phosphatase